MFCSKWENNKKEQRNEVCFIDLDKAFDRIQKGNASKLLYKRGVDYETYKSDIQNL